MLVWAGRIGGQGHTMEMEMVARANGSPRMLLGRNLPILCVFGGLLNEGVDGVTMKDVY